MKLALAVLVVVAGCNEIYGLDATTVRDPFTNDSDRDSVRDELDNCPLDANVAQDDLDGDGLGDECDHCPFCAPCEGGANHDEDGDLLDDACDNCPATDNPGQDNTDGDDLGNACDPSDAIHRRRFFEGFRTLSQDWLQNGAPWVIVDDGVIAMPGFGENTYLLRHRTVQITSGEHWFVEIGIDPNNETLGGMLLTGSSNQLACHVILPPGDAEYLLSNNATPDTTRIPGARIARLRLSVIGAVGAQKTSCEIVDVLGVMTPQNTAITYPLTLDLRAVGGPRFRYVDVIGP